MRDRNPAVPSKECPKCGRFEFRLGITTHFIRHYGAYCKFCRYQTTPSVSESEGCREWDAAKREPSK